MDNMSREKQLEYCRFVVEMVIRYAKEQGVKLRYSDFPIDGKRLALTHNTVDFWGNVVNVFISNEGRWAAQLRKAKDNFLNYVNARVLGTGVRFSFSIKELDLMRMKDVEADEDMEKVIRRITKLLALADLEHNPSENEAISASLAAQKLLAKYNLSMADVTGEKREEDIEQVVADVGTGNKWKYDLSVAVADNYACKTFSHGAEMIVFYGYKADVLIARRVFTYLFKVGNRLANQYVKKYRDEQWGSAAGIYNSFVSGFTAGVRKELEKQCTALALVVQPEVEEAWNVYSASFKTVNRSVAAIDDMAYREGIIEGKRALNAQYLENGEADA